MTKQHTNFITQTLVLISTLVVMSAGFTEGIDSNKKTEKSTATIEQHPPHEHGAANLTIAVDANQLQIDLESPADNIFGFEYVPTSKEDKQKAKDAVKQLKDAKTLFSIPKEAQCHLDKVTVASAVLETEKHGDNNNPDKHEHQAHNDADKSKVEEHHQAHKDSDKSKAEEHHQAHKDSDKSKAEEEHHHHAHNDVDVSWVYTCQSGKHLSEISPHFFTLFSSGFKQLKVEWLTSAGASSRLIKEDTTIKFNEIGE